MEYLSYKAKNNLNLKDKPKIYFTSTSGSPSWQRAIIVRSDLQTRPHS